jgi:hypothetical protein
MLEVQSEHGLILDSFHGYSVLSSPTETRTLFAWLKIMRLNL